MKQARVEFNEEGLIVIEPGQLEQILTVMKAYEGALLYRPDSGEFFFGKLTTAPE